MSQFSFSLYSQRDNYGNEISLTCDTIRINKFDTQLAAAYSIIQIKDSFSTKELLEFIRLARTVELIKGNRRKKVSPLSSNLWFKNYPFGY